MLSWGFKLHDPASFAKGGIILGMLPECFRLEDQPGMGLSSEGYWGVASICLQFDIRGIPVLMPMPHLIGMAECRFEGSTMVCSLVQEHTSHGCHWIPSD